MLQCQIPLCLNLLACYAEELITYLCRNFSISGLSICAAASQKVSTNQLVQLELLSVKLIQRCQQDWVDGRMCAVVQLAITWLFKLGELFEPFLEIACDFFQVDCLAEAVGLSARIRNVALVVESFSELHRETRSEMQSFGC